MLQPVGESKRKHISRFSVHHRLRQVPCLACRNPLCHMTISHHPVSHSPAHHVRCGTQPMQRRVCNRDQFGRIARRVNGVATCATRPSAACIITDCHRSALRQAERAAPLPEPKAATAAGRASPSARRTATAGPASYGTRVPRPCAPHHPPFCGSAVTPGGSAIRGADLAVSWHLLAPSGRAVGRHHAGAAAPTDRRKARRPRHS